MKKNTLFAILLALFGVLTLFLSTSVIFDLFGIRTREGNYVLFVVWSNFISSLLYLFASYGFFTTNKITVKLLGLSTIILLIALIGLFYHIKIGGLYETKTIGAMVFRISITFIFTIIAYFTINNKQSKRK